MRIEKSVLEEFVDKQIVQMSVSDQCDYDGLAENCTRSPEVLVQFESKPYYMHYCRRHGLEKYKELESAESIENL
jgi:hypothetical protein